MSDELYVAFRIYMTEGLLGLNREQLLEVVKDYPKKKEEEAIDAYMKVTGDPILKTMISELPYYDLNYVDIKVLYAERKRKLALEQAPSEAVPAQKEEPVDPTTSFVEGARALNEKISKTPIDMGNNPVKEPEPLPEVETKLPDQNMGLQQKNNLTMRKKLTPDKLNQVGYANIVLMSIIVIIIVAIICVFVFVD